MKHFSVFILILLANPVLASTPVIATIVEKKQFYDEIEAIGTLRANESVDLASSVTEVVTNILFEDNQTANKGDVLLEMDAAEELAELSEQKSFLDEANRQVKRLTPLVKQGAASASALDEERRKALGAKARIDAIQSRINQRIIKAPYDGVLGLRNISVGTLAQPGVMITTIDDISIMKLDFSVPEIFISTLKPGIPILATTNAFPGKSFEGEISSIDSRVDHVTRSIIARALIDNSEKKLRPGMLMQLNLKNNIRDTLVIPEESLIINGKENFVLVIDDSNEKTTANRKRVKLGGRKFGEVEILEGLSEGDKIVVHGTLRVRPNSEIEVTYIEKNNEPLTKMLNSNKAKGTE